MDKAFIMVIKQYDKYFRFDLRNKLCTCQVPYNVYVLYSVQKGHGPTCACSGSMCNDDVLNMYGINMDRCINKISGKIIAVLKVIKNYNSKTL